LFFVPSMINFNKINNIIWDWNGTMLNDAQYCVTCMNKVLTKRDMRLIDISDYRTHFTFPVKDYYEAIGFNFKLEDFEVPAMEFINEYYGNIKDSLKNWDIISLYYQQWNTKILLIH